MGEFANRLVKTVCFGFALYIVAPYAVDGLDLTLTQSFATAVIALLFGELAFKAETVNIYQMAEEIEEAEGEKKIGFIKEDNE